MDKPFTDPRFWDCECKQNYLHPKDEPFCSVCGKHQEEMPDSRTVEVEEFLRDSVFARMDIKNNDLSLHMSRHSTVRSTIKLKQTDFARGLDIYNQEGTLLAELNFRLTPKSDGVEFDLTLGEKVLGTVKILAWDKGRLIANKELPSRSVTVHLKPPLGEGR